MAVSAEHRTYNNTLYNNPYYIQTCGGKSRKELSDSLHRILSEQRPEKPAGKNPNRDKNSAGNLGRIHGSCSEEPILRRLHSWKVFALIYLTFPQSTENSK